MPDEGEDPSPRKGQIVTFYSFKGGTGRTMALANVAWILAANGKRVLIADWDLESPGLLRFFQPFTDAGASDRLGIVDFVRDYAWAMAEAEINPEALHHPKSSKVAALPAISEMINHHIDQLGGYVIPLSWQFPDDGALHFLSPGKQHNGDYQATLASLDWDNFYDYLYGAQFLTVLRELLKSTYDYVLIDSRTGHGDVSDICTIHLPDMVIDCFTLTNQAIDGAAMIAKEIKDGSGREITVLPVPMRIDHAQKEKVEAGLKYAASLFEGLPTGMSEEDRRTYWATVEVPYRPSYAYEETLSTFYDRPGSVNGLLPYYERIAALITGGEITTLPPREEWLRLRTRLLFSRTQSSNPLEVILDFSPEDQLWAEWVAGVLASAEITVRWVDEVPTGSDDSEEPETLRQTVAIVSESYAARVNESPFAVKPDLLISVTEARVPNALADVPVAFLAGLPENRAADVLINRLNGRRPTESELANSTLSYPGSDRARVQNIPTRNVNFTGRNSDLRQLRDELRTRRMAVFQPLVLHGLGGVGKTQVALEYAHRFRADYDIIWWMDCGMAQYVDASLADLGQQLREQFGVSVPEEGGVTEVCRQVLRTLSEDLPDKRWLLVYDNAEDIGQLKPLLPVGGGHVLITSQNDEWQKQGISTSLEVDKFLPEDSVRHLRRRLSGITEADARTIARILQDIPLAVAAAGALLAVTGMSVDEYLERLRCQPTQEYPTDHPLSAYAPEVAQAWNLSLDELGKRSAAAARMLGICSVMAPEVSQDLVNSQAMAETLRALDPTISERAMIARLTRQIDLLALIKVDNNNRQIQLHRVVRAVVSDRMSGDEKAAARLAVHRMVVDAKPKEGDVDDPQNWRRYRAIWPHLTPSGVMWSADPEVRQLLIDRVRYLRQRDDLERGRRRAEEIQRAWRSMLTGNPDPELPDSELMATGPLDPEAAQSLRLQLLRLQFNLANMMRDLAEFEAAREIDQAVLDEQMELLGPGHLHTLQTRSSLAGDMRALGDYKAALELDMVTYESSCETFGDDVRSTLNAAHNLALSYLLTGLFRQALAQDRQTLERRASVLGSTNPRTFNSGSAVARDLLEAGRYEEAVTRMETVWGQCVETLGDNDRITLNARLLLGVALRCVGRTEAAGTHIEWARNGLTRGFGRNSTDALSARLSQALNLLAVGQVRAGRAEAEEVLVIYQERLGDSHPLPLICRLDIATALCLEGDFVGARIEAETAAIGLQSRLGDEHPYTFAAQMVLATVLARQGRLTEARDLEQKVVSGRERVLRDDHPDTLRCRANLLLSEQELKTSGAADKRQQVLDALSELIGSEHPDVTTALRGNRLLATIDPPPF
jgi:MinD-like ATPase involved in chromosome partitioning or flagellar assembly/tetratricopeptide (TPR) repeat protein